MGLNGCQSRSMPDQAIIDKLDRLEVSHNEMLAVMRSLVTGPTVQQQTRPQPEPEEMQREPSMRAGLLKPEDSTLLQARAQAPYLHSPRRIGPRSPPPEEQTPVPSLISALMLSPVLTPADRGLETPTPLVQDPLSLSQLTS